jgi:Lrp/AsnC family transcriptional regulator, leucine-responsive regulatory protein
MIASEHEKLLDFVGWRILGELQADGRISWSELGRRVGLSTPSVVDRVRRMEAAGIISGYRAVVNPSQVGLPLCAIIRIAPVAGRYDRTVSVVKSLAEVLNADRVADNDAIVMKVALSSVAHFEAIIDQLMPFGDVTASLVLSSIVEHRELTPPPASALNEEPPEGRSPTPMRPQRPR